MNKIKVNGTKYVRDGDNFIEEDKLKAHKKRMETFFKVGGKLSEARLPEEKKAIEGQKD